MSAEGLRRMLIESIVNEQLHRLTAELSELELAAETYVEVFNERWRELGRELLTVALQQ